MDTPVKKMEGKIAVVTESASGIEETTTKSFAEKGCKVALFDINGLRVDLVMQGIKRVQEDYFGICGDVVEENMMIGFSETL